MAEDEKPELRAAVICGGLKSAKTRSAAVEESPPSPPSWLGPAVGSNLPPGCFVLPHDAVAGSPGPLQGRADRPANLLAFSYFDPSASRQRSCRCLLACQQRSCHCLPACQQRS